MTQTALPATRFLVKIVILGTRGIPACYGGFETFAEELGARLVELGHEVTVFGRYGVGESKPKLGKHRGVSIEYSQTIRQKYLETPLAALTSFLKVHRGAYDVALLCNAANSPLSWILRLKHLPLATNVDGIERERKKWNGLGKLWYRLGEWSAVKFSDVIVSDAEVIAEYYREVHHTGSSVIPYGCTPELVDAGSVLEQFGLSAGKYILYVSRLEPENNALGVIQAYGRVETEMPLVIVGDAPYADEYKKQLRTAADKRVIFTGFQFGDAYRELRSHPYLYVQATEVGGTHPALVEAMAYGNCIVANDVPEHREVLEGAGSYYSKNNFEELTTRLQSLVQEPAVAVSFGKAVAELASKKYDWKTVVDKYLSVFERMVNSSA